MHAIPLNDDYQIKLSSLTNEPDELGQWKPVCNRFGREYVEAYHAIIPKAEPVDDYDGRIDLYKL